MKETISIKIDHLFKFILIILKAGEWVSSILRAYYMNGPYLILEDEEEEIKVV